MDFDFIPIDYEIFNFENRDYIKLIGRSSNGKRVCVIDKLNVCFWAILEDKISEKKTGELCKKIEELSFKDGGKTIKAIKTEVHNKKFLGQDVKAIKIFVANSSDASKLSEKINFPEINSVKEQSLNSVTRYILEKKIVPLNKYKVSGSVLDTSEIGGISSVLDVEMCVRSEKIELIKESLSKEFMPKVLAFDIETDEFEVGKGNILMISLVSEGFKKVLTWKKIPQKVENVEYFNSEKEMLEGFVKYFKQVSPDILTGYFSDNFDLPYLKARAEINKVKLKIGIDGSGIKFSGGMSPRGKISGIVHVDLLKFIDTAYSQYLQSETLGLNDVANELIGEKKKDYEFKQDSKMSFSDWKDFFEYNLQDSVLTYKLFMKSWPDMYEFSRVMQEPLFSVSRDGMSANVEHYIIHNLSKYNEIIENKPEHDKISKRRGREKYEGAFVLQPVPKLYEDIVMFDFTSYWPSIIASFNLSLSTFLGEKKPKNFKDSEMLEVEIGHGKKAYFSKKKGFFPEMLEEIIKLRKQYKEEFKKNPSPILKARSNAFKLLANASYGYQGFFGARYYCPEASAATTAVSRDFIKKVIEKSEKNGFKVIYGDSVDGKTKVFVKKDKKVFETEIENLFEKIDSKNNSGKEYNFKKNIEVLTLDNSGKSVFRPLVYVMRHNCNKKMYRIWFTNNWYLDVSEDHSLIGYQSTYFNNTKEKNTNFMKRLIEIKPNEIKKKANSLVSMKKLPYDEINSKNYPKEVYEFMGYFIGDGSFVRNNNYKKYNKDYYLRISLGKDGPEIFEKLINPLIKKGYLKSYWWSKSRKGDLTVNGLKLINIISNNFSSNGKKIIPEWLIDETEENVASFLRGLFSADGCVMIRNNAPIIKFTSIYDSYIESVRKLLYKSGMSHSVFRENSINKYKSKDKIYSNGSYSKNIIIKNKKDFAEKIGFLLDRKNKLANIKTNAPKDKNIKNFEFDLQGVKKIEQIEKSKYVYDIEVEESHKFFANYVLVHNTDSVCLELKKQTKKQALEFLKKINDSLPGIMELELEDFYKRGIWVTTRKGEFGAKKKYALINEQGKMKIRGFETVRRDWCNLARDLQNKVLFKILNEGNEKSALEYTKEIIKKVKERKIDKKSLIIRTQLKKSISDYKAQTPHVTIARRLIKEGFPVNQGMLIEYFIGESTDKKALTRERAMLPEDDKNYDIEYYLEKQILPAVENIFMVFSLNTDELIKGRKQKTLGDF